MDWRVCCSDVPQLDAAGVRYYAYITDSVQEHYASNVCLIIVLNYMVILELRLGFKMFNGEAGRLALRL